MTLPAVAHSGKMTGPPTRCILACLLLLLPVSLAAQHDERSVRAAFVFHLTKYVEWSNPKNELVKECDLGAVAVAVPRRSWRGSRRGAWTRDWRRSWAGDWRRTWAGDWRRRSWCRRWRCRSTMFPFVLRGCRSRRRSRGRHWSWCCAR